MSEKSVHALEQLLELIGKLREAKTGCAWTREQTFASLAPQTLEESYELLEVIETSHTEAIQDELGDLLYHVLFYTQIAQEKGLFDLADVAKVTLTKHEQRMPSTTQRMKLSADETNEHWEQHKLKQRKANASVLDGVSYTIPELTRAVKLQNRAARVGFDWPTIKPVFEKLQEEIHELQTEIEQESTIDKLMDEYGDLLFACTNLARHLQIDPETALRHANRKFTRRFQAMEAHLARQHKKLEELNLEEMDDLWEQIKEKE